MYHRVVEVLVESASLYSAIIVVLLVFEVRKEGAGAYIEEFAIAMRVSTSNRVCVFSPTTTSLLGNCANNSGRPRCSRAYTPR